MFKVLGFLKACFLKIKNVLKQWFYFLALLWKSHQVVINIFAQFSSTMFLFDIHILFDIPILFDIHIINEVSLNRI